MSCMVKGKLGLCVKEVQKRESCKKEGLLDLK